MAKTLERAELGIRAFMRRFLKFTVRDFLWLSLLIATIAGGVAAHHHKLETMSHWKVKWTAIFPREKPVESGRHRRWRELSQLSDERLMDAGRDQLTDEWLSEMADRKLAEPLAKRLNHRRNDKQMPADYRLEPLIALRRAQGKSDPLEVRVTLDESLTGPRMIATLKNVDVDDARVVLIDRGTYDRKGRLERWQVELTDENGRRLPQLNDRRPWNGSLDGSWIILKSEEERDGYVLNLREYLEPPPSGEYSLRAFYHNQDNLAGVDDIEGRVYSQSAPLRVRVYNPDEEFDARLYVPSAVAAIAGLLGLIAIISALRRAGPLGWRDLRWSCLIVTAAVLWQAEQLYLADFALRVRAGESATWTMQAIP